MSDLNSGLNNNNGNVVLKQSQQVKNENVTAVQNADNVQADQTEVLKDQHIMLQQEQHLDEKQRLEQQRQQEQQKKEQNLALYRQNVYRQMPPDCDRESVTSLLSRQDRMVFDLSSTDENDKRYEGMRALGDVKDARDEVAYIDKVIEKYLNNDTDEELLTEDQIRGLNFKKARDLAQILVNDHSRSDSSEMKSVKVEIVKLSQALEGAKNTPATADSVDDLIISYGIAIKSCEDYLYNPKKNKKNARYSKVLEVWKSMCFERDILSVYRQDPHELKGTIGDLLHMSQSKESDITREMITPRTESNVVYGPHTSTQALTTRKIFSVDYTFVNALSNKNNDKKALVASILELRKSLKNIRPNTALVDDISVLGNKVRIIQKADNSLYVVDNHSIIPLGKTAELVYNQIETEILRNPALYGMDAVSTLLDEYDAKAGQITLGDHSRIRSNLIEFLRVKLGLKRDDFTNVSRSEMTGYARAIISGSRKEDSIKKEITESTKSEHLINGIDLTEMMEIDDAKQEEMNAHVSMYREQVEDEENDWSEEEKSVKNLLAELVYTDDTLVMDKNANDPAEYVRTVLQSNIKAVLTIIKQGQGNENDIIDGILKKMSLDDIHGDGEENFANVVASGLRDMCSKFKTLIGESKSDKELEDKLKNIINNKEDAGVKKILKSANEKMEESIKKSCDILQKNVKGMADTIFDPSDDDDADTLDSILKNASRSKKGQGKFTRIVFKNYFGKMDILDQRSMLASVLRNSKKQDNIKYQSNLDLVYEIRERNLSRFHKNFPGLMNKKRDFNKVPFTEAESKAINDYRNEKRRLESGTNFLAGLVRGAGPLFQKMMQGLPTESLPKEFQHAIKDVKSKLPPIPERVVKTQIHAMIKRSGGTITRIEIIKNLGAASVGQTFRAVIYGPKFPTEGKKVVIKLLRPDVQNRMNREKKIMLDCARETDEGMYETYKGQLDNYYAELDLTREKDNIVEGEVYNGKFDDVESEKINGVIDPTVDSLVLEEAEGSTLDDILLDAEKYRQNVKFELFGKKKRDDGRDVRWSDIPYTRENLPKIKTAKDKMIAKINELVKKRDIMANICDAWVSEAIFGSGYYHADLHAGNILISDTKGTIIDYGNAVKFTGNQQEAITQMMTAATAGSSELFFTAFNSLLDLEDENFAAFYNEKKPGQESSISDRVKAEFDRILNMGEGADCVGQRISAALIKAQELGVKLPPAIYNFSQGQLRLQKSINDINDMIESMKWDIDSLEEINDKNNKYDSTLIAINRVNRKADDVGSKGLGRIDRGKEFKSYVNIYNKIDKETFVNALLDNEFKKGDLEKGDKGINKREEFDNNILGNFANLSTKLLEPDEDGNMVLPDFKAFVKNYEKYKKDYKNKAGTKEQSKAGSRLIVDVSPRNTGMGAYDAFGGEAVLLVGLLDALVTFDTKKGDEIMNVYKTIIPTALEMEKKIKELRTLQDKGSLSEKKKKSLTDEIYDMYTVLFEFQKEHSTIFGDFTTYMVNFRDVKVIKKDLAGMLEEKETTTVRNKETGMDEQVPLGKLLEEKVDDYINSIQPYLEPGLEVGTLALPSPNLIKPEVYSMIKKKLEGMKEIYSQIAGIQMMRYYNDFYKNKPEIKSYDFSKVMKDVIKKNWGKFMVKVGFINLAKVAGDQLMDIMKAMKE